MLPMLLQLINAAVSLLAGGGGGDRCGIVSSA